MTEEEGKALAIIEKTADEDGLRRMMQRARERGLAVVEKAALRRLVSLSPKFDPGTVEYACWQMVLTVEELRRLNGRKGWRMNHLRPKIEREKEVAALEACVLRETDGFREVLDYGMPELTAEVIVLRHSDHFSDKAREAARERLMKNGIKVTEQGNVVSA